jgi:nicotinamide phosphoribosyltransferase
MFKRNPILSTDSYKIAHFKQYPPGTTEVSSYIEARGGPFKNIVFNGLQGYAMEKLEGPRITIEDVFNAELIAEAHGEPFNRAGWERIVYKHGGCYPIEIQALPEGFLTRPGVPLVQVRNTDPELPWLTSYVETALLRAIWYPTTVASLSRAIKEIIYINLKETSDNPSAELPFKLHDFGARGASSQESTEIGSTAHMLNFMGTDSIEAIPYLKYVYGYDGMPAFSIPASEHSTITSWLRKCETNAYANMIEQFGGEGKIYACVSDSYDIFNAVSNIWGKELKQQIIEKGGTLVVRPDSGDPVEITLKVVQLLDEAFGSAINTKGYKVLHPSVRLIQGDGVNADSIKEILNNFKIHGYSGSNIAFGMGGALVQGVNRDTAKFAMKANEAIVNGEAREVFKDPVTDSGKRSKLGRQAVVAVHHGHTAVPEKDVGDSYNFLQPVFRNGVILKRWTWEEAKAYASLPEM